MSFKNIFPFDTHIRNGTHTHISNRFSSSYFLKKKHIRRVPNTLLMTTHSTTLTQPTLRPHPLSRILYKLISHFSLLECKKRKKKKRIHKYNILLLLE